MNLYRCSVRSLVEADVDYHSTRLWYAWAESEDAARELLQRRVFGEIGGCRAIITPDTPPFVVAEGKL